MRASKNIGLENSITSLLRSWRKGGAVPAELLQQFSVSSGERFRELIDNTLTDQLPGDFQKMVKDPHFKRILENEGGEIFRQYSKDERGWAALYLRYISVQKINVETIAKYIGYSSKQFRRFVSHGKNLLIEVLQEEGLDASNLDPLLPQDVHLVYLDTAKPLGIEKHVAKIIEHLAERSVSIEGVGGIGKTTLAREVITSEQIGAMFDEIIWVSAKQEWLSMDGALHPLENSKHTLEDLVLSLAEQLGLGDVIGTPIDELYPKIKRITANRKCLIIVDNLETVHEVDEIVPRFLSFESNATRILFTSRKTLYSYPSIQIFPVPELSYEHSRQLVEREMLRRSVSLGLEEEVFSRIYKHTGGIPIALTLIAAQLGRLSPEIILAGFKNHEQLFTYIYRQAWLALDEAAIKLLLSMLFISPDGATENWVFVNSKLPPLEFKTAIEQLLYHSLIEISGSVKNPIYLLHRLTITFLRSEVLETW